MYIYIAYVHIFNIRISNNTQFATLSKLATCTFCPSKGRLEVALATVFPFLLQLLLYSYNDNYHYCIENGICVHKNKQTQKHVFQKKKYTQPILNIFSYWPSKIKRISLTLCGRYNCTHGAKRYNKPTSHCFPPHIFQTCKDCPICTPKMFASNCWKVSFRHQPG